MHMNPKKCSVLVGLLVVAASIPASADITWNVTYVDLGSGVGFDDPTFGATRRGTVSAVLNYINSRIDANGTVDLEIRASDIDGSGPLASAGPYYFTGPNGFANGFVFDHATTGFDPSPAVPDATATFDFGYVWNNGLGAPGAGEFDLFSVALHEVTHAMGFSSLVDANGQSSISGGDPGVFGVFDSFLELGDGTDLFGPGGDFLGVPADLISNNVYFNGANAMAANGGAPVQVYAPTTFASGSSISHLNDSNALMSFAIAPAVMRRAYSDIELGILADIGWSLASIPEPSSAGFLLVLFGVCGLCRRNKR